ncbi:PAS domain-containing sensor histidine kinase [Mesorhizobium sp. M6A.T.Ce.TU.016.01.1.1]|uniref:hybrid sensor histidine kinase/response regulator n=1 Tax=Mesorhizobium sp. M6A.T.Ce.TU.016.01.1.1 TaxID=2496783 RepID=UPI000FCCC07D|nr:PAS domain-containing sensor histidine kinase [Mesorhizobium sp. M6A.T.Ce.TU.016.01.1.1]RUU29495.1 PAS domain-containing sensor histidine kinase [Mesorhizobium sp. M6A.T.Ce.TU.016.01.1.1]
MPTSSKLSRHFASLMAACVLPLVALVAGIGLYQSYALQQSLLPYALILLGLLASVFALHRVLLREIVGPAISLVDHVRSGAAGETTDKPGAAIKTSALWQPWIDMASSIFAENRRALRELADSEQRYRNVVEAQTEYIIRVAPDGRMSFANDAYCRLVGKTREELLSPDWHYFNSFSADFGSFDEIIGRVTPERPVCEVEETGALSDGRQVHIHWTDRGIFDASGKLIEIQSIGRDVAEQKLARQALEASEQRYRSVVELQTEFVVRMSPEGHLSFVNDAYCRACRMTREQLLDPSWCELDVLPPDERRRFLDHLARLTPQAPDASMELLNAMPDGVRRWLAWNDHGIFDSDGRLVEVQSVGRDISDRVLAEQARIEAEKLLAEREAQFRAIAEGVPLPITISAIEGPEILFVNEPARRTLGIEVGQIGAEATSTWEDLSRRDHLLRLLLRDGIVDAFEAGMTNMQGSRMDTLVSARLITQAGRSAMLAAVTDITRQREAEAEIARQRETLYQSEKLSALGSLLAGVAHELNNPLSVVIGYSSMLKEFSTDKATVGRADKIHAAAERCSRIVRTFLAMARKKPPTRGAVDINEVVVASLELAAYSLRSAGVEIRTELAEPLPNIWGDRDQLHQVITNLVVNAQQALLQVPHPRRLTIVTSGEGDAVEVVVADNGPGMPETVRARAFEPFYTTKMAGEGTGVGLSVCQGIVTAHDGSIELDSTQGGGARFTVRLPSGKAETAPAPEAAGRAPPAPSAARILVVDDDADIASMIAEMLRRDGHDVTIADDANAALKAVRADGIDLLISDIRMPGLDGPGLYRALEQLRPGLAKRLLFVTGDTLAPEIDRFIGETGAPVIEKPLDPQTFRRLVMERLRAMETSAMEEAKA